MLEKIKNKSLLIISIAALLYLVITIYADFDAVIGSLRLFNWYLIPLLLLLSVVNYFFRFLKWDYYLRILNVQITRKNSLFIFMTGLIMSISPGKLGEIIKPYLVRQVSGEPVRKTSSVVLGERLTDFISLAALAVAGAFIFNYGKVIAVIIGLLLLLFVVVISVRRLAQPVLRFIGKLPFVKKYSEQIETLYESSYQILKPKPLFLMWMLSSVSWFFECLSLYIILQSFSIEVSISETTFIYAFSTIVGALSMLPGGLGLTEGSMVYFLNKLPGATTSLAVSVTFIIRLVTLWFAVFVGVVSTIFYQRHYGEIVQDENAGKVNQAEK